MPAVRRALLSLSLSALAGCVNLAPRYERPVAPVPSTWAERGAAADAPAASYGVAWQDFVAEPRLRRVVESALVNNRDLRIAVANVERARALYRIQAAARVPALAADAAGTRTRSDGVTTTVYSATLDASYELDLFSRIRNLSDAALASYFGVRENRRAAELALVTAVVDGWVTLAADEEQQALAERTLANRRASFDLTDRIHGLGGTTGLAVAQSRSAVEAARVALGQAKTQVALDRNALELLIGAPLAGEDDPGGALRPSVDALVDLPGGLSTNVLQHRPDVQASERSLIAATTTIGAARAAFLPRITLASSAGLQSSALDQIFRRDAGLWSFGPAISLPIFDGGVNRANLDIAFADRDVAGAAYEKTVQSAFREVADVLAARRTLDERLAGQRAFVDSAETSLRLSDAIFRQGGSSYLAVLTAEQTLFGARQTLIALRLEEQTNRVALYRALGGAWRDEDGVE